MLKQYECPMCQGVLETERDLVPREVSCPHCHGSFTLGAGKPGPGMTVGGYRIEQKLGSGGMGDVWLATQLSMERKVALKILPSSRTQRAEAVLAFTREARLLAKLDHPHIVTAFDFGEYAGLYYLAMTYVEGEDLALRLQRAGPLSEPEALGVALKTAQALEYAWTQFKLLHRDVNPANIMIDRYGDVRLMDLGIGKTMQEGTEQDSDTHLVGTPNYMSPEQAEGRSDLDCRADMFALGATLYHLVTGQVPFDDPDPLRVLARMATESLPDASSVNRNVSAECGSLIARLMQRNRDERFASWNEVIKVLKQFTIQARMGTPGTPSGARPETGSAAAGDAHRKPAVAVVLVILAGLLIGFAVLAVSRHMAGAPEVALPPPEEEVAMPEDPPPAEEPDDEAMRTVQARQIRNRIKAAEAYMKGADPDYDQAVMVVEQIREDATAAGLAYLVADEITRIRKRQEKAASTMVPKPPVDPVHRELNGQEQARLQALYLAAAEDVVNREFANAQSRVKQAKSYAWPKAGTQQLALLQNTINTLSATPDQVCQSYAGEAGREILVPLLTGKEKLRIVRAEGQSVEAEIVLRKDGLPAGSLRRSFAVEDLDLADQMDRVGAKHPSLTPLLRAMVALQHQEYELARQQLDDYEGIFAGPFKEAFLKRSP